MNLGPPSRGQAPVELAWQDARETRLKQRKPTRRTECSASNRRFQERFAKNSLFCRHGTHVLRAGGSALIDAGTIPAREDAGVKRKTDQEAFDGPSETEGLRPGSRQDKG